jgi:hypothetical protein
MVTVNVHSKFIFPNNFLATISNQHHNERESTMDMQGMYEFAICWQYLKPVYSHLLAVYESNTAIVIKLCS